MERKENTEEKVNVSVTISMTCSNTVTVKVPKNHTKRDLLLAVQNQKVLPLDSINQEVYNIKRLLQNYEKEETSIRKEYLEHRLEEMRNWNVDEFEVIEN